MIEWIDTKILDLPTPTPFLAKDLCTSSITFKVEPHCYSRSLWKAIPEGNNDHHKVSYPLENQMCRIAFPSVKPKNPSNQRINVRYPKESE